MLIACVLENAFLTATVSFHLATMYVQTNIQPLHT